MKISHGLLDHCSLYAISAFDEDYIKHAKNKTIQIITLEYTTGVVLAGAAS